MKLAIHSDLHTEFYDQQRLPFIVPSDADYLIFAGDITTMKNMPEFMKLVKSEYPELKVIFVLGNHEFYGQIYESALATYRALAADYGFHLLEKSHLVDDFHKIVFYGGVLWSDFSLANKQNASMNWAYHAVSDFRVIKKMKFMPDIVGMNVTSFTPEDAYNEHKSTLRGMKSAFKKYPDYKHVVITHFLPSIHLVHSDYRDSLLTSAYWASNIKDDFLKMADVWIYGHSHNNINYDLKIDEHTTRFVCNQGGYPYENNGYKADYVLEI